MKKILYSAAAIALAFFSASCQQENLEPTVGGTVTYTVQVPDAIPTKAIGDDITGVTKLIYEVYKEDESGNLTAVLYESVQPEVINNGKFTFELEFIKNHNYTVLFWAYNPNAQDCYNTEHLTAVTLNQPLVANNEAMAVFSGSDKVRDCQSVNNGNVTLVRPVAQINIVTNNESLAVGSKPITLNNSSLTVEGLYTTYNVADKTVTTDNAELNYTSAAIPAGTFTIGSEPYTYVAMNYVGFVPELGDNVDLDLTIKTSEGDIYHEISNVPVKPNYRTNIYGNLITASSDYAVELKADWTDVIGGNMEVIADGLVKNINGDYEVTNAAGLAYAINNLFANGGNFYLTKELYEMAGYDVNPPASVTGSLNVYGEIPVVTRSTARVVTITGLNLTALVTEVSAGGSASFSNIKLESKTDFVGTNKGTVGFDNCSNNEGSSTEQIVGTNNGTIVDLSAEIETLSALQDVINTGTKDIKVTQTLVNKTEFTLDLKGSTINGVDNNTSGNFYLIDNRAKLTIKNSASTPATITLKANNNRNWNASSVVVANNPGGNLIIKGDEGDVVIEHLGGSDMAYGVDNLTNGKGTSAIATLDGATVKSTYRAIRQFLNGIEAINELYVNAGSKIYGPNNKSIWMQDPSKNANTGKLVVDEGAELYGDVYLSVTEGSTEWPVSVSIASSALVGGSEVLTANLPEGYSVDEQEGAYVVNYKSPSQSRFEELIENGGRVTLVEDVQLSSSVVIENAIELELDLNGKTITGSKGGDYAITNNGKLTIKDSQGDGVINGVVYDGPGAVTVINGGTYNALEGGQYVFLNNSGTLSISNATINACTTYPIYSYNKNNKLSINGDVVINATFGCINAYGDGCEVEINGGTFQMTGVQGNTSHIAYFSQNAEVFINAGTFQKIGDLSMSATGGGGVCVNGGAQLTINGGSFSGDYDDVYNYGGFISVKGGTYKFEPDFIAEGYKAVQNAVTGKWEVVEDYVAKVGEKQYKSLQDAFKEGGEITLLSDVMLTEMAVLESGKTATLDLNGYAITVPEAEKHIYALNNKGTLTIKDSEGTGRISARGIYNGYNGNSDETVAGAKLTVENGNFYALDSDGGACILNCAEAIINGGTFDGQVAAVNGRKCGKTTINGGTFKSVSNYVIQQNGGGELTINKATVDRGFGAVGCFGGKVTIIDGTYMPTGMTANTCHVVYVAAAADVTINGGTYKMNYPENAVPDSGSAVASYYNGTLSISGGTFYAHFDNVSPVELSSGSSITGGTFYNHSGVASDHQYIKNFIADGYVLNNGTVEESVPVQR